MSAKRKRKSRTVGEEIIQGLQEILAYERGELTGLRTTMVSARDATAPPAPQVRKTDLAALRAELNLSQSVLAQVLNVSVAAVRSWEQGTRQPDGAALRLIELAVRHPEWIAEQLEPKRGRRQAGVGA